MIEEKRNFIVRESSIGDFLGVEQNQRSSHDNYIHLLKKEMFTDKKINYGDTVTIHVEEYCFSGIIKHVFTYEFTEYDNVKSKFVLKKIDSKYNKNLESKLLEK